MKKKSQFLIISSLLILSFILFGCSSSEAVKEVPTETISSADETYSGTLIFAAKPTMDDDYELYQLDLRSGEVITLTENTSEDIAPDINQNTLKVAQDLLGCFLIRKLGEIVIKIKMLLLRKLIVLITLHLKVMGQIIIKKKG